MLRFIEKYGFFRITLIPLGISIVIGAVYYGILGMGIIGSVVIVFGMLNKCLLQGQCEVDDKSVRTAPLNKY